MALVDYLLVTEEEQEETRRREEQEHRKFVINWLTEPCGSVNHREIDTTSTIIKS